MDETLGQLRAAYFQHAPLLVAPLLETLIAARDAYGGDMDVLLILLSVALRQAEHGACREVSRTDFLRGARADVPGSGTNIRSIAESTGIPRETVRRKVRALEAAGLLLRNGQELFSTPASFEAFGEARESIVRMAAQNSRTVEQMLKWEDAAQGGTDAFAADLR